MTPVSKSVQIIVWGGLALAVVFVLVMLAKPERQGPLPAFGKLTEFSLTNQLDQPVGLEDLLGRVWIADIIFTRCPLPCLKMSAQMSALQKTIPEDANVGFLSLTTDPDFDTPEILKRYGKRFEADPERWWFLTGEKDQIRNLAMNGLKLVAEENPPEQRADPDELFIHSTTFVLVDKQGRLRGTYQGEDASQHEQLLADIKALSKEKP